MDKNTVATAVTREQSETSWQKSRMEIEREWASALHSEESELVPTKLPISLPPVRHAA